MHLSRTPYRFPAQYCPFISDWNSSFDLLLPPARGWNGNDWPHRDDAPVGGKIAISYCRYADCELAPAILPALHGQAATEVSEYFSRLQFHLLAKYGEQGAVTRAHMLFEAFGPVRDVDPKELFSEDADGDSWTSALGTLKS